MTQPPSQRAMIQVGSHEWVNPAHIAMIEGGDGGYLGTKAGNAKITLSCGKVVPADCKPKALLDRIDEALAVIREGGE